MAQSTLTVKQRNRLGKGGARQVRRDGNIPSILYGRETEPIPIVVNPVDLKKALSTEAGENTLLEIKVEGGDGEISKLALLRDIQFDYLTSQPIHLDFQEVQMKEKLNVRVPVRFLGIATGVKNEHGILEEILREIEIECFPKDIPNFIEVDVSALGLGDSIHIGDLMLSGDLTVQHEPDDTIVTVLAPRVEEVAAPAEAVGEAEEAEEVAAAEKTAGEEEEK